MPHAPAGTRSAPGVVSPAGAPGTGFLAALLVEATVAVLPTAAAHLGRTPTPNKAHAARRAPETSPGPAEQALTTSSSTTGGDAPTTSSSSGLQTQIDPEVHHRSRAPKQCQAQRSPILVTGSGRAAVVVSGVRAWRAAGAAASQPRRRLVNGRGCSRLSSWAPSSQSIRCAWRIPTLRLCAASVVVAGEASSGSKRPARLPARAWTRPALDDRVLPVQGPRDLPRQDGRFPAMPAPCTGALLCNAPNIGQAAQGTEVANHAQNYAVRVPNGLAIPDGLRRRHETK